MNRMGRRANRGAARRTGAAALDYVLVLGVAMVLIVSIMWTAPRIIGAAYEMVCVLVTWPFM